MRTVLKKVFRFVLIPGIVTPMLFSSLPIFTAGASTAQSITTDYYTQTTDYYIAIVNPNGTLKFVNKTTDATIVDDAPAFFLNYGNASSANVSPVNPSFEIDTNSDGIPDGWTVDEPYIRQSSDYADNGTRSLKFDMTSVDTTDRTAFSSLINCDPDKSYSVSVDSYYGSFTSGVGQADVLITYYDTADGSGSPYSADANARVSTDLGVWKTNRLTWVPPFGAKTFRVVLYVDKGEISTLYFDNVSVTENTPIYETNGADVTSTIYTSGDNVTVQSTDNSNHDAIVSNTYRLNIHSPNVTFASTITYTTNVTVSEERYDFLVPTQQASIMTRDMQLNTYDPTKEYDSDLYTPKVVKFGNGLAFLGDDTMQAMRLRANGSDSQLSFYADYYLDHPFSYYVKNGGGLMTDISEQERPSGNSHSVSVTFTVDPGTTPKSLVKSRAPLGYNAVLVLTNHADYETLAANYAVAYGTDNTSSPAYGHEGILGRGLGWTKSVWLSGESGTPYVDLSDPAYKALTDNMSRDGAEIITHAISNGTDNRSVVESGLQFMQQYGARDWIDHGAASGVANWQDLASQGTIKGDPNYTLDLLAKYGYDYAWSYQNFSTGDYDLNMLSAEQTDERTPFFYYNRNVDDNPGHDNKIYLWSAMQTNPLPDVYYAQQNIDNLIAQRGVSIGHDYLANATDENHSWYTDSTTGATEITPTFDSELAYIAKMKAEGLLWVPTMAQFGDYLVLLPSVSVVDNSDGTYTITNNNTAPINGLTLLAESDVQSATLNGAPLTSGGGSLRGNEVILPALAPGQSVTLAVFLSPAVSTSVATGIGTTCATLNGSLASLGSSSSANVSFDWGTSIAYGNTTSAQPMTAQGLFSAPLTNLVPGVTYHFRARADGGSAGIAYGTDMSFTTYGTSTALFENYTDLKARNSTSIGNYAVQTFTPDVTHTVTMVKLQLANGGATSGNLTVSIKTTDTYGQPTGPDLAAAAPLAETSIGSYATDNFSLGTGCVLQAGAKYSIYLHATTPGIYSRVDTAGTYSGGWYLSSDNDSYWNSHNQTWDIWFEEWGTASSVPPTVTTADATPGVFSATLNGSLISLGTASSANVSFLWGTNASSLTKTTAAQTTNVTGPFSAILPGLSPSTTYYYQAQAAGAGIALGLVNHFTTNAAAAPSVETEGATNVSVNSATLNGDLNSLGTASAAGVFFKWGTSQGSLTNLTPQTQSLSSPGAFNFSLTGLSPSTTYYFQAMANGGSLYGTSMGTVNSFTTQAAPASTGGGGGAPVGGGGVGGGAAAGPGVTNLTIYTNYDGLFNLAAVVTSQDGKAVLNIAKGVLARTGYNTPLTSIKIVPMDNPPSAPANSDLIGQAYQMTPEGATFSPAISLTIFYDPSGLPQNTDLDGLTIAVLNTQDSQWEPVDSTVNKSENNVTAMIGHFSDYALIGKAVVPLPPPAPASFVVSDVTLNPGTAQPGQQVNVSAKVSNTGGASGDYEVTLKVNGSVEATKTVSLDAGSSSTVTFAVTEDTPGNYQVDVNGSTASFSIQEPQQTLTPAPLAASPLPPPSKQGTNTSLIIIIVVAAVVVAGGILAIMLMRRRS